MLHRRNVSSKLESVAAAPSSIPSPNMGAKTMSFPNLLLLQGSKSKSSKHVSSEEEVPNQGRLEDNSERTDTSCSDSYEYADDSDSSSVTCDLQGQDFTTVNDKIANTKSFYVAESKFGIFLEELLMPVIPKSAESLVTFLIFFSLGLTLPMGIDRFRFGKWVGNFAPLELGNRVLGLLGFEPFFQEIVYIEYGTDEQNPTRPGIDLVFGLHIVFGLLWIVFGGLQIVCYKSWSRTFHRRFGYFATAIFLLHCAASLYGLWKDLVHHHALVKALLFHDLVAAVSYFWGSIQAARNHDVQRHKDMAIRGYLHSIEGSGHIRFTGMILHLIGKVFRGSEIYIHTAACQHQSNIASAADCVGPYVLRLQLLRLLSLYFYGLYLRTEEKSAFGTSRKVLAREIQSGMLFLIQSMIPIYMIFHIPQLGMVREFLDQGSYLQMAAMGVYTVWAVEKRSEHL